MKTKKIILCIMLLCITLPLSGEIISIPDDYATIQLGIIMASDGDTILVAPSTYYENIDLFGKNIMLTSYYLLDQEVHYIHETIIDGSSAVNSENASTVTFCSSESEQAILQGFTITGGGGTAWVDPQYPQFTWYSGGGVFMYMSSPTIRYNLITMNAVSNVGNYDGISGGGLLCFRGNPKISNNIITLNHAGYGAGIVVDYSGAIIKNNIVAENTAGTSYGGGGFYTIGNDTEPIIIENNTIVGNHSGTTGGGLRLYSSIVTARNNIIWGNTQNSSGQIFGGSTSSFTYCDVEGGFTGEGNINEDPLFADTLYHLTTNSQCVDAGNPDILYYDPENPQDPGFALYPAMGTLINDMGAYGGGGSGAWVSVDNQHSINNPKIVLHQNYPNPFNPCTTICFQILPKNITCTQLEIYNLKGEKIKTLPLSINGIEGSVTWDGMNEKNESVSNGVYLYKLNINISPIKKMIFMK